jgi:hypothetical protein
MPTHKKQNDPEAAGRRTDKGEVDQLDSAGQGLPVEEDTYVSKSEGISGQNVGRLTRPR